MNLSRVPVVAGILDRVSYAMITLSAEPNRYVDGSPYLRTKQEYKTYSRRLHQKNKEIAKQVMREGRGITKQEVRRRLQKFLNECPHDEIRFSYTVDPAQGVPYNKADFPDPYEMEDVYRVPIISEDAVRKAA